MNASKVTSHVVRAVIIALTFFAISHAVEPSWQPRKLQVAEGFAIEAVANPSLVERPVTAAFGPDGSLYVADSSGSNEPVQTQLKKLPHRIVRLVDNDGDGIFDVRTIFADKMMFPSGTMFHAGSLYVSAPPSIWKLTDTDGDGVADKREEWFKEGTLTNCANDLHGPYLGLDGWVYWCKGGDGEQTHQVHGRELKSRAAHVFRCRPDGSGLETVLTGGMDNPIDVVFTPGGERLLTSTFVVHPGNGERDGLLHAIYGGVYGKDRDTITGHPRSGELMPIMTHLGPGAPSGLLCYESTMFGDGYRDNLFACQFNMHKVSRHIVQQSGSTFVTTNSDFVTTDDLDFHPTDIVEDADGSVLVIDTGGWYKLCCPTSQLEKVDALGGIYRIRKVGAEALRDPRGRQISWSSLELPDLWSFIADERPAVRARAIEEFASRKNTPALYALLANATSAESLDALHVLGAKESEPGNKQLGATRAAQARLWALCRADSPSTRAVVRNVLKHPQPLVRQVALQAISLHRDEGAVPALIDVLKNDVPANRRVAAEALGRIGSRSAVAPLLAAAGTDIDRVLRHSIIYALIEIGDADAIRAGVVNNEPGTVQAALIAADQISDAQLPAEQVISLLNSQSGELRQMASWIVARHPEWADQLTNWFGQQLATVNENSTDDRDKLSTLEMLLTKCAGQPAVQDFLAQSATESKLSVTARLVVLRAMVQSRVNTPSSSWCNALAQVIAGHDRPLICLAIAATASLPADQLTADLTSALAVAANDTELPAIVRVQAIASLVNDSAELSDQRFSFLTTALSAENPVALRSLATDALAKANLSVNQLERLCEIIEGAGPLEMHRLLDPFGRSTDEQIGLRLLSSLKKASSLSSLQVAVVQAKLAKYGPEVRKQIEELYELVHVDIAAQRQKLNDMLPHMASGDVRRGQVVFYSAKATCAACHRMGYTGGQVGPDLSRVGETRSERDLLEAILFPSLSFVRSFEPTQIATTDGKVFNGLVRSETPQEIVLTTGANQEVRIDRNDIEEMRPGTVSVMPAGLDQQLTVQELADLVAFLKRAK